MNPISSKEQVCIVTSDPYPESEGEEEAHLRELCYQLRSRGTRFTVVSSAHLPTLPGLDPLYVPRLSVPIGGTQITDYLWVILAVLKVLSIHATSRVCVIYSTKGDRARFTAWLAGKMLRVPIVLDVQGEDLLSSLRQ